MCTQSDTFSSAFSPFFPLFLIEYHSLGPSSDWQKCKLLPQNFSLRGDNLQRIEGMRIPLPTLFFFFLSLLMPRLNGNSLSCILRGCAEHAVVTKDKKEWGHSAPPSSSPFLLWRAKGKQRIMKYMHFVQFFFSEKY